MFINHFILSYQQYWVSLRLYRVISMVSYQAKVLVLGDISILGLGHIGGINTMYKYWYRVIVQTLMQSLQYCCCCKSHLHYAHSLRFETIPPFCSQICPHVYQTRHVYAHALWFCIWIDKK